MQPNFVKQNTFITTDSPDFHRDRRQRMLAEFPNIKALMGPNPSTFVFLFLLVTIQILIALSLSSSHWWIVVAASFLVGSSLNLMIFVCLHEASHRLIFKGEIASNIVLIFANLPLFLPMLSILYQRFHLKHHHFLATDQDADIPLQSEANFVGHSAFKKLFWVIFFPIYYAIIRTWFLRNNITFDKLLVINLLVQSIFLGGIYYFGGNLLGLYLFLSTLFSISLSPAIGSRNLIEHYILNQDQETYSYYGPYNWLTFNVGYHVEHHDFPYIAWNKLPQLKAIAAPYYDNLYAHHSYWQLVYKFITDDQQSLHLRIVRFKSSDSVLI
jgi:sphingolipid delta-4 desaturase